MSPRRTSILLAIDGSAQAQYAAQLVWELASQTEARITAQHVVNSVGIWEQLGFDLPGFIGSGPYMQAHDAICCELRSLGRTLLDVFETHAQSRGLSCECVLDEGQTVREIMRRSLDHDLVVIGHKATGIPAVGQDRRRFARVSVAERLAAYCERPLLVVQERARLWRKLAIVLPSGRAPEQGLFEWLRSDSFDRAAHELWYLAPDAGGSESAFLARLRSATRSRAEDGSSEPGQEAGSFAGFDAESLIAVPAWQSGQGRTTAFGSPPELIVRYCALPAVLIMPPAAAAAVADSGGNQGLNCSSVQ